MREPVKVVFEPAGRASARPVSLPQAQTSGAAGLDLQAHIEAPLVLGPGVRALVPTGWRVAIPEGFEGQVRPRSGNALKRGLSLTNAPGTIDADYRGEVKVIVENRGTQPVVIQPGERIAQLVIARVELPVAEAGEVDGTPRGEGGFGHTGQ